MTSEDRIVEELYPCSVGPLTGVFQRFRNSCSQEKSELRYCSCNNVREGEGRCEESSGMNMLVKEDTRLGLVFSVVVAKGGKRYLLPFSAQGGCF